VHPSTINSSELIELVCVRHVVFSAVLVQPYRSHGRRPKYPFRFHGFFLEFAAPVGGQYVTVVNDSVDGHLSVMYFNNPKF